MKRGLIICFSLFLILITGLFSLSFVSSNDKSLTVTKITRISHPAFDAKNWWQGEGYGNDNGGSGMWNKDFTRILLYENPFKINPDYSSETGRGLVWGYLSTLKQLGGSYNVSGGVASDYDYTNDYLGSLADYKSNTYEIPEKYCKSTSGGKACTPVWGIFSGEENVLYALNIDTKKLVRYNVDTQVEIEIASYACTDDCSGVNISESIVGWTADSNLIIGLEGAKSWDSLWEINPLTGERTWHERRPGHCSSEGHRWPYAKIIHSGRSPDKLYRGGYGGGSAVDGVYRNDYLGGYCEDDSLWPDKEGVKRSHSHCQWSWSKDWYVCGALGYGDNSEPWITSGDKNDYRNSQQLWQIIFNRIAHTYTHNHLFVWRTAGYWCQNGDCDNDENYHGLITPTVRRDNNQIMIVGTNGAYSLDDYNLRGSTPAGSRGIYLLDLPTGSEPPQDTTPPLPPSGLRVE